MRDIGKNIKSVRQAKNMTQEALAAALYVTRQTVSNYENGHSRPDLDMLVKIAEVLDTDVSTILYGLPASPNRRPAWKWGILSCALILLIGLLYGVLDPALREIFARTFHSYIYSLRILNLEIVLPATMFFLGWALLHFLSFVSRLQPFRGQPAKIGKILLLILGSILLLVPLPFYIWQCVAGVRSLLFSSVSMVFPPIPVYHQILQVVLSLSFKFPFFYCLLGGLYWLFGIFSAKAKENTQRSL